MDNVARSIRSLARPAVVLAAVLVATLFVGVGVASILGGAAAMFATRRRPEPLLVELRTLRPID